MSWTKLRESVSASLNDHLRLRNDYLMAENCILRHQIDGRVQLTDGERKEFAAIGAKLGKKALAVIATVAQEDGNLARVRPLPLGRVTGYRLLHQRGLELVWADHLLPAERRPLWLSPRAINEAGTPSADAGNTIPSSIFHREPCGTNTGKHDPTTITSDTRWRDGSGTHGV